MTKGISALVLAATIAVPSVVAAAAAPQDRQAQTQQQRPPARVYDRANKDYHAWDQQEDRAYRSWLDEQHQPYRTYSKLKRTDQDRYWQWRHAHPDDNHR